MLRLARTIQRISLLTFVAVGLLVVSGCGPAPNLQVPVKLHVTNHTTEPITVRWKDNRISGESEPISPGEVIPIDAQYTTRGAGDFRVFVIGASGETIRVKRFDGEELRAAKFTRKLTVNAPR